MGVNLTTFVKSLLRKRSPRLRAREKLTRTTVTAPRRNLLSLPDEFLLAIYKTFFKGLELRPYFAEDADDRNTLFEDSKLALLLLHKSQQRLVQEAMWECVSVTFKAESHLAALAVCTHATDGIQTIHFKMPNPTSIDFCMLSKTLRKLPRLKHLRISETSTWHFCGKMQFKHYSFLAEAKDPLTELQRCVEPFFKSLRSYGQITWLVEIFDSRLYSTNSPSTPWKEPPRLEIMFELSSEFVTHAQNPAGAEDAFEQFFKIPVVFTSDTWAVSGVHNGRQFEVRQASLAAMMEDVVSTPISENILLNQSFQESEVWDIVDESFSDIVLHPKRIAALFEVMHAPPPLETAEQRKVRRMERTWVIGLVLFAEYEDFDCILGESDENEDEEHEGITPEQLWDLWRRILCVKDQKLLARPWKAAFSLVEDIDKLNEPAVDLLMSYYKQEVFSKRLFDADQQLIS